MEEQRRDRKQPIAMLEEDNLLEIEESNPDNVTKGTVK